MGKNRRTTSPISVVVFAYGQSNFWRNRYGIRLNAVDQADDQHRFDRRMRRIEGKRSGNAVKS